MPALFLETTTVEDTKTVGEIQELLSRNKATHTYMKWNNGRIESLEFGLKVGEQEIPFQLPCRWQAIETILKNSNKKPRKNDSLENMARRIAWRQIFRWLQAQLALIQTRMVKAEEVFLPYAVFNDGTTMYQQFANQGFKCLMPAKQESEPGA